MSPNASSVEFVYLYRDGSNYKSWGTIVFANKRRSEIAELRKRMEAALLAEGTFVAHQVRIPDLFLYLNGELTSDDHCYHEFHDLTDTDAEPTDRFGRSIDEFMKEVERESSRGWKAFEPAIRLHLLMDDE